MKAQKLNRKSTQRKKNKVEKIIKNKDEVLRKRRKRKRRKNLILVFFFLISILATMCLKLPQFLIKNVQINDTKNVDVNFVETVGNKAKGQNLFLLNTRALEEEIKQNKYVKNVNIKRKFPNKITINIEENDSKLYMKVDKEYWILDSNGNLLDKKKEIKNMELIEILGFSQKDIKQSSINFQEDRQKQLLKDILRLSEKNTSEFKFTGIDISNITSISVRINNINVKIGTDYKLKDKLNKALNIMRLHKIKNNKGYIDISHDGNPVVNVK